MPCVCPRGGRLDGSRLARTRGAGSAYVGVDGGVEVIDAEMRDVVLSVDQGRQTSVVSMLTKRYGGNRCTNACSASGRP